MDHSRASKSLTNVKVNLFFYFILLILSFFSRTIFLSNLGDDFMGLVGTLQNILSFLNLVELGVGTAIGYVLYKPIYDKDSIKINEIISIFGYLYKRIGQLLIILGIILAFFIPLIFSKTDFSDAGILFAYFSFLISSLIGYFANYQQALLSADQKNYVVTVYYQSVFIVKTLIQMTLSYYTKNYYLWIAVEVPFAIIFSILLNKKIKEVYPWLSASKQAGKDLLKKYPEIVKYTKQLFVHRIAYFIQYQSSSILIYSFVSLKIVAYYINYTIIINKLSSLAAGMMDGTGAGVGNLIAEGDKKKIISTYWELMSFRYFISGILVFALYYLMEPFISLWLGKEYVLGETVLILILANIYISQTRNINDIFINGYGLFNYVWAPVAEALISILGSIIAGHYLGLPGVLLGPVLGLLLIVGLWKPYFLYSKGFKISLWPYWRTIFKFLAITAIAWVASAFILKFITINPENGYLQWTIYAICVTGIFSVLLFALMYISEPGMRKFFTRIKKLKILSI